MERWRARRTAPVWRAFWIVIVPIVAAAVVNTYVVLTTTFGFDQASPVGQRQRLLALAGVVAVGAVFVVGAVAVVCGDRRGWPAGSAVVVGVTLAGLACVAPPLWRQVTTIDVTDRGFHRAGYSQDPYDYVDLYVYNARRTPIVICVSSRGACVTDERFPAWLRAPGGTVPPRVRADLRWPKYVYGRFTLSIVSGLPAGARAGTELSLPRPSYDPDPYRPPPYPPPPPPPPPPIGPFR